MRVPQCNFGSKATPSEVQLCQMWEILTWFCSELLINWTFGHRFSTNRLFPTLLWTCMVSFCIQRSEILTTDKQHHTWLCVDGYMKAWSLCILISIETGRNKSREDSVEKQQARSPINKTWRQLHLQVLCQWHKLCSRVGSRATAAVPQLHLPITRPHSLPSQEQQLPGTIEECFHWELPCI